MNQVKQECMGYTLMDIIVAEANKIFSMQKIRTSQDMIGEQMKAFTHAYIIHLQ
jgi:hypothetical protein